MTKEDNTHRASPSIAVESSRTFCRSCALCCDGTIFSRVPLCPDEVEAVQKIGIDVLEVENKPHFVQPCAKLTSASCSVYKERPNTCRTFRCRVLRRLDAGELRTEEAHALVNQATHLVATIRGLVPIRGDPSWSIWTHLVELARAENLTLESIELSSWHRPLGTHAKVLRELIDNEFRPQKVCALSSRMDDETTK